MSAPLVSHARLADAPRDELRVLPAEIENQNPVGMEIAVAVGMAGGCP